MTNNTPIPRGSFFDSFWKTTAFLAVLPVLLVFTGTETTTIAYVTFCSVTMTTAAYFDPLDHPIHTNYLLCHALICIFTIMTRPAGIPASVAIACGSLLTVSLIAYRVLAKGHSRVPDAPPRPSK